MHEAIASPPVSVGPMSPEGLTYVDHVRAESQRLVDALRHIDPEALVPTCPQWTAADLLWHIGEVQSFWARVVDEGVADASQLDTLETSGRPGPYGELVDFVEEWAHRLVCALEGADPQARRWMWVIDPAMHTAGYIARRQAHEALIHRVDAELTAERPVTPIDAPLAADGVDEALRCMHAHHPGWGQFTASGRGVRLQTSDTGNAWAVELGRFAGVEPHSQDPVDEASLRVLSPGDSDLVEDAGATVTGSAADLDLWLWNRPSFAPVQVEGDPETLAHLRAVVHGGVE